MLIMFHNKPNNSLAAHFAEIYEAWILFLVDNGFTKAGCADSFSLGLFESSAFYDYDNRKISKFE